MDQTAVSQWELNKIVPRDWEKLAQELEIDSPAWLAFGTAALDGLSEDSIRLALKYESLSEDQKRLIDSLTSELSGD